MAKDVNILKVGKVYPDQYSNVFVTSDLHFGHSNVLQWEPGRYEILGTNFQTALYNYGKAKYTQEQLLKLIDEQWEQLQKECNNYYIDKHDEELIRRWNSVVGKNDLVFILGDLSFRRRKRNF